MPRPGTSLMKSSKTVMRSARYSSLVRATECWTFAVSNLSGSGLFNFRVRYYNLLYGLTGECRNKQTREDKRERAGNEKMQCRRKIEMMTNEMSIWSSMLSVRMRYSSEKCELHVAYGRPRVTFWNVPKPAWNSFNSLCFSYDGTIFADNLEYSTENRSNKQWADSS